MVQPLPWHQTIWQQLQSRRQQLPHAILLHGMTGIGKAHFSEALAASLLCEAPHSTNGACGHCQACNWLSQGNHPDFRRILPPADMPSEDAEPAKRSGLWIGIEAIRDLTDFVQLTSHRSGVKVVLIPSAEKLNQAAANALLKTLEEPPAGVIFILVCQQLGRVLPTIRSRCQKISLPAPARGEALAWLADQRLSGHEMLLDLSGGMPLLTAQYANDEVLASLPTVLEWFSAPRKDPVQVAQDWSKLPLSTLHDWLGKWLYDLLRLSVGGQIKYYPDKSDALQNLAGRTDSVALMECMTALQQDKRLLSHPLNQKLMLENWLFSYRGLWQKRAVPVSS